MIRARSALLAAALVFAIGAPAAALAQQSRGAGQSGGGGRSQGVPGGGASSGPKDRMMSESERNALVAAASVPGKKEAPIVVPAAEWLAVPADNLLVVDTNKGRIVAELSPLLAPETVQRVQALARQHFYDGLTFFRVIATFMDQTGDPKNTGEGGSTLPNLKAEFTFRRKAETPFAVLAEPSGQDLGFAGASPVYSQSSLLMELTKDHGVSAWGAYCPGVLGMAREDGPDTANSQFFFMREAYPTLERRYTAFGKVLIGLDVVRSIKVGEPVDDPQDRMTRVRLASDLPAGEKIVVMRQDPQGSAFKAQVARTREIRGADFSVCDVAPQVKLG